jgi:hypothetical protein
MAACLLPSRSLLQKRTALISMLARGFFPDGFFVIPAAATGRFVDTP